MNLARALPGVIVFTMACQQGALVFTDPKADPITCETSPDCNKQICQNNVCIDSAGKCSARLPEGDCPLGRSCISGACLCSDSQKCECPGGSCLDMASWCGCTAPQGCNSQGVCVDIVANTNACSSARQTGVCPGSDLCVGGECVPVNDDPTSPTYNACSDANPTGLCAPGLICLSGYCLPLSEQAACSDAERNGACPAGQRCTTSGGSTTCQRAVCSEAQPFGFCLEDEACIKGVCKAVPCSVGHLGGVCQSGNFCSKVGTCIPNNTCAADGDCSNGLYCSSASMCRSAGACDDSSDCVEQAAYGQGFGCSANLCLENTTCAAPTDCKPDKFCSSAGNCRIPGTCDGDGDCGSGKKCGQDNTCIDASQCEDDDDCEAGVTFCSETNACIALGSCGADGDCDPGFSCSQNACVITGQTCNSNTFVSTGCANGKVTCCEAGKTCCPNGQHCSSEGVCIDLSRCSSNADCLEPDFVCDTQSHVCTPVKTCVTSDECDGSEFCSQGGSAGCIDTGRCVANADCLEGETCRADFTCSPVAACGSSTLEIGSLVAPNVLVIIDHSASMNLCGAGNTRDGACARAPTVANFCDDDADCSDYPDRFCTDENGASPSCPPFSCCDKPTCSSASDPNKTTTRWSEAVSAVKALTQTQEAKVNFGLSIYPKPDATKTCSLDCNWASCTDLFTQAAGVIDKAVSSAAANDIANILDQYSPGGGTPTAPTLRTVLNDPAAAGLAATDRQNAILLVTDGEAVGDSAGISTCSPPCADATTNGSETDVDCGGLCEKCADAKTCRSNDDCQSNICAQGICRPTHCQSDQKDGDETDLDCGGSCLPCDSQASCTGNADCRSQICTDQRCVANTCSDATLNGSETDVDCGGSCTLPSSCSDGPSCAPSCSTGKCCADGKACIANTDCQSGVCLGSICRPASCTNNNQDGDETAQDCGGSCMPCGEGEACNTGSDCQSNSCPSGTCETPDCENGILDAGESDVDCGGSCAKCGGAHTCNSDTDCLSNECVTCANDPLAAVPQACRVNAALDRLYALDPPIKTFVVGFAFDGANPYLNCHAVHGKTARDDGACASIDRNSCVSETNDICYYEASDQEGLQAAFDVIVSRVSSCAYTIDAPPNPDKIFVYVDTDLGPGLSLERLDRSAWEYDRAQNQFKFVGNACERLKSGTVQPVLTYGCVDAGG